MFKLLNPSTNIARNRLLAVLISCLAVLPVSAASVSDNYKTFVSQQIERLFKQQQPQRALEMIEDKRESLNQAQFHGLSCQAFVSLKKADQAIEACSQAIEYSKLNEQWIDHNNLGAAYLYSGELQAAQASFKNALVINRTAKNARRNLELTRYWIANPDAYQVATNSQNKLAQK